MSGLVTSGGFMLISHPNGTRLTINYREAAPKTAKSDLFKKDPNLLRKGVLSIAVPGEIKGFSEAHKR